MAPGNSIRYTHPLLPPLGRLAGILEDIWREGWLTNRGRQHDRLELALKEAMRCENVTLFCNGTIALLLGLRALGLRGEVITTPFTFPATVHAIQWAGLTPVFCDIDPATLCIDPHRVEEAVTERTSAIVGLHAFGIPCDVEALAQVADRHGLKLVFDAAHAFGTEINGTPIGLFGDMSMFSFHATKLFHTAEGGALVYQDASLGEKLRLLKNFGIQDEEHVVLSGLNGKMNEIQAALGLCVMEMVEDERRRRESVARQYLSRLTDVPGIICVQPGPSVRPSLQYFPILVGPGARLSRDEVFRCLREAGIHARRYFHPLCSQAGSCADLPSASPENLPQATRVAQEILCLPFYGGLEEADIDRICTMICG